MLRVYIKERINPNHTDIKYLSHLQNLYKTDSNIVVFDFEECEFIDAGMLTLIGSLPSLYKFHKKNIHLNFMKSKYELKKFLINSGFANYFSNNSPKTKNENAIPFTSINSDSDIVPNVEKILNLAPIIMDEKTRGILFTCFYEVFNNAFTHSNSIAGIFFSGYWYPNKKELVFAIYDTGIGIPNKVKEYLKKPDMCSEAALEWALTPGMSTLENVVDYPRGIGLNQLEDFIKLNKGTLIIASNDIFCIINEEGRKYTRLNSNICGTIFHMNIVADTTHIYITK